MFPENDRDMVDFCIRQPMSIVISFSHNVCFKSWHGVPIAPRSYSTVGPWPSRTCIFSTEPYNALHILHLLLDMDDLSVVLSGYM